MTFECATNMNGYTINFFYGKTVLPNETTFLGSRGKRTTFIATSNINGTDVFCSARMGMVANQTGLAYLYIQGILTHTFLC